MKRKPLWIVMGVLAVATPFVLAQVDGMKEAYELVEKMKFHNGERRIQHGPVLVIERMDKLAISHTSVLVDSEVKKDLVVGLLQSAFPKEMGPERVNPDGTLNFSIGTSVPDLSINTIDEYVAGMVDSSELHPNGYRPDPDKMREKIKTDLGDNFAVVYRWIEAK